jgi:catechol 2,3-dioxygenase-like lactoylglutathione lyase family enzyme
LLHYVSLKISDIERSGPFYDAVLAPLGWRRQDEGPGTIGWGVVKSVFFVTRDGSQRPGFGQVSFAARSIPAVKAAFAFGLENGGRAEAEPSATPTLGNATYAARLYDPDGYLIEICAAPE